MSNVGNQAAWAAVVTGLVFNPDTAMAQRWLQEKSQGNYIGLPVSDEIPDPETGGTQMAFSSGAVILWDPNSGTTIA